MHDSFVTIFFYILSFIVTSPSERSLGQEVLRTEASLSPIEHIDAGVI